MFKRVVYFGCRYHWLVLFSLLLFWLVFGYINVHTMSYKRMYLNVYPLTKQAKISQTFRADYPGLYRVDIYFNQQGHDDKGEVIFHLKDSCDTTDLQTLVVPVTDIVDDTFHPFIFAPIADSAGRQYCIVLELQGADKIYGGIYASGGDAYPEGTAYYSIPALGGGQRDNKIVQNNFLASPFTIWLPLVSKNPYNLETDIGFQLYYKASFLSTLQALLTRLSFQKPGIFGNVWFYIFLFLIYLVGLSILLAVVLKKISREDS